MSVDTNDSSTRLNKYLALQLGISRREADNLIDTGAVAINGELAVMGSRATEGDEITIAGRPIAARQVAYRYVQFNKPVGYVCSRKKQGDNETIYAILPPEFHSLKPVGRLDRDSSGILLLTNDGDFAQRMTHPKYKKVKVYHIRLNRDLEPLHQQMISDFGIQLEDGRSQLTLQRRSETNRREWQVTMSEGRNRQIRRTFSALGYIVKRLHRTQFGNYSLGDMRSGEYKLTDIR